MKTRKILYVLTLMAYSLSLAHSIIPHHHHRTADEAASHEHGHGHDHHHARAEDGHDHDDDEKKNQEEPGQSGHFFFFSHDNNVDVVVKTSSSKSTVKSKNVHAPLPVKGQVFNFVVSAHLVYHPPQHDPWRPLTNPSSRALRAPPELLS